MNILIVEDDKLINEGIKFMLECEGYEVFSGCTIKEGNSLVVSSEINLIVLDINLPDGNGLQWCKELREKGITKPIIMLTAKDTDEDMIRGFQYGADDYISKPFSLPVLKERIKAVLRRFPSEDTKTYVCGDLKFDFEKMTLMKNNKEVKVTPTEYKLLTMFIENKGKVLTREQILDKLWDIDGKFVDENTLSVNIRRIRGKIEDSDNKYIKTIFGVGYCWEE